MKTTFFFLLVALNFLFANNTQFKMLQSNLISGLIPDVEDGYGVVFRDLNEDGYPDVYLVCFRNMNRLLVNNGGIIPFVDRTIFSGLGGDLSSRGESNLELGASSADYNNDGVPDLFLAGWGKTTKLFQGKGEFRFNEVTEYLNFRGLVDANQGLWLDADNDGFLDLYITDEHYSNRLLINNKNGTFRERPWSEGFVDTATSQGALSADFDGDGDRDIYVSNWHSADYLLLNDGTGFFQRTTLNLPTLIKPISSNSAAYADLDNDGRGELIVAGQNGLVYLYRNLSVSGQAIFEADTTHPFYEVNNSIYGVLAEDFNQDGWLDIFLAVRENHNRLYLNNGQGGFNPRYDSDGQYGYSTGSAAGDVDGDGDLDIFVANKNTISQVYLNPVNTQNFLKIRLTGVRSNRDAIGAKCYLYSGRDSLRQLIGFREVGVNTGYLSSKDPELYFGLSTSTDLNIKVVFPSANTITRKNLQAGHSYHLYEYGTVMRSGYALLHFAQFHIKRLESWYNFILFLIFAALILIYLRSGFKRYQWQAPEMAIQLIVWFVLALISYISVKNASLLIILSTLIAVSTFSIVISISYSEHQFRIRLRRVRFRNRVQLLSTRMINIHSNEDLQKDIRETLLEHEDIKSIRYLNYNPHKKILETGTNTSKSIKLDAELYRLLSEQEAVLTRRQNALIPLLSSLEINVIIPVKQGHELLAVIGIDMQNYQSAVNREDLQLLLPLANQTAIAIENNNYIKESERLVRELTESKIEQKYVSALEQTNRELDKKNRELNRLFKELQQKEGQLIHSEKMASLGHLVAGISHELNNPISFIYANTKALDSYITQLENLWGSILKPTDKELYEKFEDLVRELKSIITDNLSGSRNVKELVQNLKNFSRLDQADWKEAHLVEGIESSLKILKPQITEGIEVIRQFEDDPLVFCNPGQLNQVFLNLLSNALQAMEGQGRLTITTKTEDDGYIIEITDTGTGIPADLQKKIFDPFFTTKDVNQGSGLGLSISYTIMKGHKGKLLVKSKPGQGSTFSVCLPLSR